MSPLPSTAAGSSRANGLDASSRKAKKPSASAPWAPSAAMKVRSSSRRDISASTAPETPSTVTHKSIEPSWFPQAPLSL